MQSQSRFVTDAMAVIAPLMLNDAKAGVERLDDAQTMFFERQLESIEAVLYQAKLRPLKADMLIPVSNRDPAGSATITYYLWDKVGIARILANPSDVAPRADAFATRHTAAVRVGATSFAFTTQDLRNAQVANVALEERKADAARRAMDELQTRIAWTGDPDSGLLGVTTNPNIPADQVPLNQAAASRLWEDKTAQEIIADVADVGRAIRVNSREVHPGPYTLIAPIDQIEILKREPIADFHPTVTIFDWLISQNNAYNIEEIVAVPELEGTGPGGTDQFLMYEKQGDVLEQRIPMPMVTLPPERRGFEFIVNLESEFAGVVVRFPLGMRFGFGI